MSFIVKTKKSYKIDQILWFLYRDQTDYRLAQELYGGSCLTSKSLTLLHLS